MSLLPFPAHKFLILQAVLYGSPKNLPPGFQGAGALQRNAALVSPQMMDLRFENELKQEGGRGENQFRRCSPNARFMMKIVASVKHGFPRPISKKKVVNSETYA